MSITIRQEPSQMNSAYTKLMYSVVSSNTAEPQFKYLCDVLDDAGNLVSRLRQGQNSADGAIFNVAVPCRGVMQEDDTLYLTDPTASIGKGSPSSIKSYKQFTVAFGEEYGTSISSSVTVYDGKGSAGVPAVSGSDLVLNRAVWEPWNENQFISASTSPVYSNSGTGSLNFFVYEASGGNYVDNNLRVNGVFPAGGFGGSGSFAWSGSQSTGNGEYLLEVISLSGVSSADQRFSLEVYDMSNQQMIIDISDVSGSGGTGEILISTSFTGSIGNVYGCRTQGIPTSSFNPPLFQAYYAANNYTASSDVMRSITYPLFPNNVVGVGGYPDTKAWQITTNIASGSNIGDIDSAFPTLEDFSKNNIPTLQPLPQGNFGSWNWNYQDSRINFIAANPNYPGVSLALKLFLTNWPQIVDINPTIDEVRNMSRTISQNDLMTTSWYNISGSVAEGASYAIEVALKDDAQTNIAQKRWTNAELDALTPLIRQVGSGADIPFVTCPVGPASIPTLYPSTGSDAWTNVRIVTRTDEAEMFFIREEPCEWQTRTNFAFINKWGVWDFVGVNTPTNKSAVITERDEYMSVNADYNSQLSSYSAYNRGFEQYYLGRNYRYKIATDPIPLALPNNMVGGYTAVADFYQELFTSPSVYIQQGYKFIPINITNSNFRWKTNIRSQKIYQLEIEYELSNQPRSRT